MLYWDLPNHIIWQLLADAWAGCLVSKTFAEWKMGRGWPMWHSYLSVTIVEPYPPGSEPYWGAGGPVSHSFPRPTRGTSDPRLLRKATPCKSIFRLEHGTSPCFQDSLCLKKLFLNIITLKIERKKRKEKEKKRCSWSLQSYDIWPFSWDSPCPYLLPFAKLKRKENIFIDGELKRITERKYFCRWRILFIYTLLLRPSLKN